MSILNRGQITKSRLAADPKVFDNTDGSKKVMVTVYVDGRYTGADGSRPSDRFQLQTWIVPTTDYAKTPFAYLHKGDAAAFEYELRSLEYADKEGSCTTSRFASSPTSSCSTRSRPSTPV